MHLSHHAQWLAEDFLISCLVSGLRDAIKYELISKRPTLYAPNEGWGRKGLPLKAQQEGFSRLPNSYTTAGINITVSNSSVAEIKGGNQTPKPSTLPVKKLSP